MRITRQSAIAQNCHHHSSRSDKQRHRSAVSDARGITSGEYRYMLFAGIHPLCRVCDIPLVDISHKTGIGFVNRNDIAIILVARLPHKRRRMRLEGRTPEGFRGMSRVV